MTAVLLRVDPESAKVIRSLAAAFNALPSEPGGTVASSCGGGSSDYVLARFVFPRHRVDVRLYLGGCYVTNGDRTAGVQAKLIKTLVNLTR